MWLEKADRHGKGGYIDGKRKFLPAIGNDNEDLHEPFTNPASLAAPSHMSEVRA